MARIPVRQSRRIPDGFQSSSLFHGKKCLRLILLNVLRPIKRGSRGVIVVKQVGLRENQEQAAKNQCIVVHVSYLDVFRLGVRAIIKEIRKKKRNWASWCKNYINEIFVFHFSQPMCVLTHLLGVEPPLMLLLITRRSHGMFTLRRVKAIRNTDAALWRWQVSFDRGNKGPSSLSAACACVRAHARVKP